MFSHAHFSYFVHFSLVPLPAVNFEAESSVDKIRFSWDPPADGEYDQYVLAYSTCDCSDSTNIEYKYFDEDVTEYELMLPAETVVFASLIVRSQVECASHPVDSEPKFIYGVETGKCLVSGNDYLYSSHGNNFFVL